MVPRKLIEALFARLWLLVVPVVLAPMAVIMFMPPSTKYESSATVWVDRSVGGVALFGEGQPWLTPAQHQATALNELLSTRRFRLAVANRAGLLTGNEPSTGIGQLLSELDVSAYAIGTNLMVIRARSGTPGIVAALVDGVISEFRARFESEANRTAAAEAEYYKQQLELAQAELHARQAALEEYLTANPEAAQPGTAASVDLNYRTLLAHVEQQMATVIALNDALQDVDREVASAPQAFSSSFVVQDAAEAPLSPVSVSPTERLGLPIAAMLLGALTSATYLYIVYRTDHTVGSAEDLHGLNVVFLGDIPELQPATGLSATFPLNFVARLRRRHFARRTASSIAEDSSVLEAALPSNGRVDRG